MGGYKPVKEQPVLAIAGPAAPHQVPPNANTDGEFRIGSGYASAVEVKVEPGLHLHSPFSRAAWSPLTPAAEEQLAGLLPVLPSLCVQLPQPASSAPVDTRGLYTPPPSAGSHSTFARSPPSLPSK
jgi:hypothetical protein